MKLVRQINKWTCLPAAVATHLFSMCDDPLQEMFDRLGHDGSEVVRQFDQDPQRRRGFHPQEMFELAMQESQLATTQIDLLPSAQPDHRHAACYFKTVVSEDHEQRFARHLQNSYGWASCMTRRGTGHALAYDYATIGDPSTGEMFTYNSTQDAESRGLYILSLFRLDRMEK